MAGSNTGLGKEATQHFARLGASKVILAVRNIKAGEDAKDIEDSTKYSGQCSRCGLSISPPII